MDLQRESKQSIEREIANGNHRCVDGIERERVKYWIRDREEIWIKER